MGTRKRRRRNGRRREEEEGFAMLTELLRSTVSEQQRQWLGHRKGGQLGWKAKVQEGSSGMAE